MANFIERAMAAEEADDIRSASAYYASALDVGEVANSTTAIRAALTFFEAKDGAQPKVAQDEYLYFDRWIAESNRLGAGDLASYWKAYDTHIYWLSSPDDPLLLPNALTWFAGGCSDALLTLAVHYPDEFREQTTAFVKTLVPRRTYRERYLYSILGANFA